MPTHDTPNPDEAARIATNAYFTLKGWINEAPVAGVESRSVIKNRVLGSASVGTTPAEKNSSLKKSDLQTATLGNIHSATTGFGTSSGFGYTLTYKSPGLTHVIVAMRGTRPEMAGKPDLLTDAHGTMTPFAGIGPVHGGFKSTFDSVLPNLERDRALIESANVVHFVGHSLGGAVATLLATHYATRAKAVKLYTFGSPRVGGFNTFEAIENKIGKGNIYRVAHDLDPISLIGPYPYIHVNPAPYEHNNMTIPSPYGQIFSVANHDMAEYINSVGASSWVDLEKDARRVDLDESVLARWLLHSDNNPGWVQYASAKTLTILFKLFSHALKGISTSLVLGLTALDFLAELLYKGVSLLAKLGQQILQLLRYAATWAGIKIEQGAKFTVSIIQSLLGKMLATLRTLAAVALSAPTRNIVPVGLGLTGAWALANYGVL